MLRINNNAKEMNDTILDHPDYCNFKIRAPSPYISCYFNSLKYFYLENKV